MTATSAVVDLTKVKEGGNFRPRRKPEGDYLAKVVKADDHESKAGNKGWVLTIQVDGDARSTYPYYITNDDKNAWKIVAVCTACGLNVTGKRINFNPNKLVGKSLGIALEDDEYDGKTKSTIADVFTTDEVGSASDGAPEGDEVYDDEDVDVEEEPEEEVAPAPRKRVAKKATPKPAPVEEEYEDEEEEVEEEVVEAPAPRRRAAAPAKKAAPRKRAATPPPADDEDELDDLDLDELD